MNATSEPDDPYLWLEDVQGGEALAWVAEQNARTLTALAGPDFERDREAFRAMLSAPDKIPFVTKRNAFLYNLWQDKDNPRGLWRRTTMESYRSLSTEWETLIDVDALGRAEGEDWVWHGCTTLPPEHRRGLVLLSRGGADASVIREFDLDARAFVADGFALPEAKSAADWLDADTLLVTSPLGDGHATTSGYARTVRRWRRGTPFAAADTIFDGLADDVFVYVSIDHELGFERTFVVRHFSFFDAERFVVEAGGELRRIDIPADALFDVHREWLTLRLRSPWTPKAREFETDSLIATRFDEFMRGGRDFDLLFEPRERRTIRDFGWARDRLAISLLDNMRTVVEIAAPAGTGWTIAPLVGVPETETADIWCIGSDGATSSPDFLLQLAGFLTPTSLHLVSPDASPVLLKELPPRFDASRLAVSQHETVAEDGVRIPYFQIGPKDLAQDGDNPTLLYGYGGFLVSVLPTYSMGVGKAWLERGGVYVVANIRGGGEFGPRWHNAGLKLNRMRVYDDFFAVSRDLIDRKITSPKKLGIMGGSNGGLLMGVALTRHPELYNAIVIQVPLFDMIGYTHIGAGASWVGEYGDPAVPVERAVIDTYSPYQRLAAGKPYPRVFLETSTKDDRVHPAHARKAAARLKDLGYDYLYYENIDGGHDAAANLNERAMRVALEYTYLTQRLMN
ncbi:MAG: prolyl oligopeptidase [Alphaproteobacteria bacterium]|nr:prolyl oligopeptidase [Alphaproteobacteria bacterium]